MDFLSSLGNMIGEGASAVAGAVGDGLGYLGDGLTNVFDGAVGLGGDLLGGTEEAAQIAADAGASLFTPGLTMNGAGGVVGNASGALGNTATDYLGNLVGNISGGLGAIPGTSGGSIGTLGFGDMFKEGIMPLAGAYNTWDSNQDTQRINDQKIKESNINIENNATKAQYAAEDRALAAKDRGAVANAARGYNSGGTSTLTPQETYALTGAGALAAQERNANLYG